MLGSWQSFPWHGPHRHGRVPLGQLDRVEALGDRSLDVLRRHVLADADEALPPALVRGSVGTGVLDPLARHAPDRLDAVGQLRRDEDTADVVVLDARTCFREQRIRRLASSGDGEHVAVHGVAVDDDTANLASATVRLEPARALPQVDHPWDCDTSLPEHVGGLEPTIVRGDDNGTTPGLQREVAREPPHALRQHHAREVVAGKDEGLFHGARRDHDPLGSISVEHGPAVHGNEVPLPDAESAARCQDLDTRQVDAAQA